MGSDPTHTLQLYGKGRELDSNLTDVVLLEVHLLPPRRWATAIATVGVTGALCSVYRNPHCGRGRKLDSNLTNVVVLDVHLLPPHSCWFC